MRLTICSRFPMVRLSAVGSKPMYALSESLSRSAGSSGDVMECTSPRHCRSSNSFVTGAPASWKASLRSHLVRRGEIQYADMVWDADAEEPFADRLPT